MYIRPSAAIRQNYNEIADMCRKTPEPIYPLPYAGKSFTAKSVIAILGIWKNYHEYFCVRQGYY